MKATEKQQAYEAGWYARDDEVLALKEQVATLKGILGRYVKEVPLGHQPHMLAHVAAEALKDE